MNYVKQVFDFISSEKLRQNRTICLIASENYTYPEVMKAQGSCLTNKYAEGYPSARYYGGCEDVDNIESLAIELACKLFKSEFANVQPHSGSQANQAVYLAFCKPGDTILGMSLDAGGHLTHGAKVSASGKLYNAVHYGLTESGEIDYEDIKKKLKEHNPRILIVGASAYPREIDFKRIKRIVDQHNKELMKELNNTNDRNIESFDDSKKCIYMVDMAHIAGLVAARLHQSPIKYADVITSTTHKTLRGPRGGIILWNNPEFTKRINSAVFPGIQGGPLEHVIAAKAVCFANALKAKFKRYQKQIKLNIKAMEEVFKENNVKMITGGSDNHLILLDFRDKKYSGKQVEDLLERNGIVTNKNAVVNDQRSRLETSGLRIGTACITARGMLEAEAKKIALRICQCLSYLETDKDSNVESWNKELNELTEKYPVFRIKIKK